MTHLHQLQTRLPNYQVDSLLIDDPINLYYLTGLDLSAGKLLVCPHKAFLLVDSRYVEACARVTSIPVILLDETALEKLLTEQLPLLKSLAFLQDVTSYQAYLDLQKLVEKISFSQQGRHTISLIPLSNILKEIRSVKDHHEMELMRKAAALGFQGFELICSKLKEGISEKELACEVEIFWKLKGAEGVAFTPIIAFGENSSMPHYRAGNKILSKGQHVLIDIGVTLDHYHSDMTRIVFFGDPDPLIFELYQIVQEAQAAALSLCRAGAKIGDLDTAARSLIAKRGYGEYFTHSLGHGIGLEVHEFPTLRNKPPVADLLLDPGMILTIEPGIYLPGKGGVRFEDTIVITSLGYENLTRIK